MAQSHARLDHVGIAVRDADQALKFYRDTFGIDVVHDEVLDQISVRLVYIDTGPTMIQLVQPLDQGAVSEYIAKKGEGLHHLCFGVEDLPSFFNNHPNELSEIFQGGRGCRASFIDSTPNNVIIELVEGSPKLLSQDEGDPRPPGSEL